MCISSRFSNIKRIRDYLPKMTESISVIPHRMDFKGESRFGNQRNDNVWSAPRAWGGVLNSRETQALAGGER